MAKTRLVHPKGLPYISYDKSRKFYLLNKITIELIIIGILFTWINIYLHFWVTASLLLICTGISCINWILLKKRFSLKFCGYLINSLCLVVMIVGNFCLGGLSSTYFGWFYLSPIVAATTIGFDGLIVFGFLTALVILVFIFNVFTPIYHIAPAYIPLINDINHLFIFLLIMSTLYNLLKENKQYETLMEEQNFLLHSDKQKFHYLSNHDSLTNLPNRSFFYSYIQKVFESTNITKNSVTLYFMDLNGFKKINDVYGHEMGDILLFQVAKRLRLSFRDGDFIARLAGDEFTAVISHRTDDEIVNNLLLRIQQEFEKPFSIKNIELNCSISIGTATYPKDANNAESLLTLADNKMYENKKMHHKSTSKQ